ncbi:TIM barrel protein [Candidatus Poribacteria bacterium]|nr:TIM barrel protein [Candidatus Poribacteria bacterium]
MKIGLCTIAFQELPLKDVLDIAAKSGFDGVEIWGKPPHTPMEYDIEYIKSVSQMAKERELDIFSFGSYVNPLMENYKDQWNTAFNITENLGTEIMRVWSGGGPSSQMSEDVKNKIFAVFGEMAEEAEKREIILAIEMHGNNLTDKAENIVALMEKINSPYLKTYYQPRFSEDADDPYKAAEMIGKYVVNVHAQNAKVEPDGKVTPCGISEGAVDYKRILKILKSKGFDGYIEVEFVHGEDKLKALKRDRDFLMEII